MADQDDPKLFADVDPESAPKTANISRQGPVGPGQLPTPAEFCALYGYNPFPAKWKAWLNAVHKAVATSRGIAGNHVSIDQHKGQGTVYNVDRRRAAPVTACPETLLVTITGVSFPCGCQLKDTTGEHFVWTGDLSGTFEITKYHDDATSCLWDDGFTGSGIASVDIYSSGHDCPSTPDRTCPDIISGPGDPYLFAGFMKDTGKWWIAVTPFNSCDFMNSIFFYGGGSTVMSSPISNITTCTSYLGFNPADEFFAYYFGVSLTGSATSGTATISL